MTDSRAVIYSRQQGSFARVLRQRSPGPVDNGADKFQKGRRALWSGVEAAAGPAAALFMTAGLVRTLGRQDYGLLVVVLAVSALSMAINPAIAATTTKYVSETVGARSGGDHSLARLVTTSVAVVAVIGFIYVGGVWMFAGELSRMLFGSGIVSLRSDVSALLLLAVLTVCIQQIDGVFAAAIRGLERFREQALLELGSRSAV